MSAKDVPGENKVKGGASDSPVFADGKVEHVGQVIGLILADTPRAAMDGASKVAIQYGHPKVRIFSTMYSALHVKACLMIQFSNDCINHQGRRACQGALLVVALAGTCISTAVTDGI